MRMRFFIAVLAAVALFVSGALLFYSLNRSPHAPRSLGASLKAPPQAWLGVALADPDAKRRSQLALPPKGGALIDAIITGSPAANAGLVPTRGTGKLPSERGDFILSVNGQPLQSSGQLTQVIQNSKPGQELMLGVLRPDNSEVSVTLRLGERPANLPPAGSRVQLVPRKSSKK